MCLTTAGLMVNNVDPDHSPRSVASDLGLHCLHISRQLSGLHCLLRPVCPYTLSKFGCQVCQFSMLIMNPEFSLFLDAGLAYLL